MKDLLQANIEVLQQLKDILSQLSGSAYVQDSPLPASSIGKHTRHVLDHYLAFRNGLEAKCIDYNQRNRESNIEHDIAAALGLVTEVQQWLASTTFSDAPVLMTTEVSVSTTTINASNSSTARELAFLVSHTIHHVTMAALLAKSQDVVLSPDIGIAPSTASYLRAANAVGADS